MRKGLALRLRRIEERRLLFSGFSCCHALPSAVMCYTLETPRRGAATPTRRVCVSFSDLSSFRRKPLAYG
ncbi:MAG: hypothetical protein R6V56_01910 [Lentisphaeria bacterium]